MNRKTSICILMLILCVLVVVLLVMASRKKQPTTPVPESQPATEQEPTVIASADHTKAYHYIAKIIDERVVIFESDGKTIYFETDIRADSLSESLKKRITRGIGFLTEESMYDFLENYSS